MEIECQSNSSLVVLALPTNTCTKIFYSEKKNSHVHEAQDTEHTEDEKLHISGTQARKMLEKKELPPEWFMRPEISRMIIEALARGEEVFVKE